MCSTGWARDTANYPRLSAEHAAARLPADGSELRRVRRAYGAAFPVWDEWRSAPVWSSARQAEEAAARLMEGTFTLEDFLEQMQQIKKMGPIGNLMGMMPGIPKEARDVEIDDGHIARLEGIIRSMTPAERQDPDIIDGSRRQRIAAGSGMQPSDVKNLLDQFGQMRKMMKQFAGFGTKKQNPKNRRGGKNTKKGKKGGRRKQGGRVTEKGPAKVPKSPLTLPGLEDGDFPPGFPSLPGQK